jgi:hypothetical protein
MIWFKIFELLGICYAKNYRYYKRPNLYLKFVKDMTYLSLK